MQDSVILSSGRVVVSWGGQGKIGEEMVRVHVVRLWCVGFGDRLRNLFDSLRGGSRGMFLHGLEIDRGVRNSLGQDLGAKMDPRWIQGRVGSGSGTGRDG